MFLCVLIAFQQISPAYAQISTDSSAPTANQAGLANAPNGISVIDIVRANGAGISHNKFTDYNVGTNGLILNNNNTFGTSQLGGALLGNPNLASGGQATRIINEVTSTNPSVLQGLTEVFGQSADVIVANPNGITCNGCGFVNTPKATLTTGTPQFDGSGELSNISINSGSIVIEGAGFIDPSNGSNKAELLSRAVQINADIHAGELKIITGRNDYNPNTQTVTPKADDGSTKPSFAIDSSALGGMYAGKITLKGTENGVGFRIAGDMAASIGDLVITNSGKIEIKNAAAKRNIKITTNNNYDIDIDGVVTSDGETTLNSSADINLNANNIIESKGEITSLSAAGAINNVEGAIIAYQDLEISAAQLVNNVGAVLSGQDLRITGNAPATRMITLDNIGGIIESTNGDISINVDTLNNLGSVQTESKVTQYKYRWDLAPPPSYIPHGQDLSPEAWPFFRNFPHGQSHVMAINPYYIQEVLSAKGRNLEDFQDAATGDYIFEVADWQSLAPQSYEEWVDIIGLRSNPTPGLLENEKRWQILAPDNIQAAPSGSYYIVKVIEDVITPGSRQLSSISTQNGDIRIDSQVINNTNSYIGAARDIEIVGGSLNLTGVDLNERVFQETSYNNFGNIRDTGWGKWLTHTSQVLTFDEVIGSVPSSITAAGAVSGDFTNDILVSSLAATQIGDLNIGDVDVSIVRTSVQQGTNDTSIFNNNALIQSASNDNFKFETRFDFTNLGTFFGSDFFISQIAGGFDAEDIPRRLGDAFIDNRYINQQVLATGRKFLDNSFTSDTDQVKALLDRGIAAKTDLNLSPFIALTPEQQAALTQDIVWYEEREVDGEILLVPQLYLAKATLDATGERLKASTISAGGDLTLNANNINVTNARVNAGGNIGITATESTVSIGGVIDGNDINIDAGQDIILTTQKTSFGDPETHSGTLQGRKGGAFAQGDLNLTAGDLVALIGSEADAVGGINFNGTDVLVDTLSLERGINTTGLKGKLYTAYHQGNTLSSVTSGDNININATNSVRLRAANLSAQNDLNVTALAGNVTIDTAQTLVQSSLRNGKKSSGDDYSLRHIGTSLSTTDGDVNIRTTLGDITLENASVDSGNDINLEATTGSVELLAAVDREFSQHTSTKSNAVAVRYKHREKEDTYVRHTVLTGEGNLNITSAEGVTVQYRATGNLSDDIAQLSQAPGLAYLADLQNDPNIDFDGIREIHREFSESSTSLGPAASAILAIAVAAAIPGGFGAGLLEGTAFATTTAAGAAAADAAFIALASQAAVAVANNGGNIFAALEELASIDTVRSLAASALTAGLTQQFGGDLGVLGQPANDTVTASVLGEIERQLVTAGISTAVDSVVLGTDFSDTLVKNLRFAGAAVVGSQLSQEIGNAFDNPNTPETRNAALQLLAHAAVGCAAGTIGTGNCGAGAASQFAGEAAALAFRGTIVDEINSLATDVNNGTVSPERAGQIIRGFQDQGVNIARLTGALASAIAGGDGDDVGLGGNLGSIAAENNVGPAISALFVAAVGAGSFASGFLATQEIANQIRDGREAFAAAGGGEAGALAALQEVGPDVLLTAGITITGVGVIKVGEKIAPSALSAFNTLLSRNGISVAELGSNFILRADNVRDIGEETVDIFRSVSQAELDDLVRTGGAFRLNPGGLEAKQFGRNLEETRRLSQGLNANDVIIRVRVPKSTLNQLDQTPVDTSVLRSGSVSAQSGGQLDLLNGTVVEIELVR